jgi:hypothetical protein
MSELFSFLTEVSKTLGAPYFLEPGIRFGFEKDHCLILVYFAQYGFLVEGSVPSICLHHETFFDFATHLRSLKSVHESANIVKLEVSLSSDGLGRDLITVHPHIKYFIMPARENAQKVSLLKRSLEVLVEMEKLVKQYGTQDAGFEQLEQLWEKMITTKSKNRKGKLLEKLMSTLISRDESFAIADVNLRTKSEELDIVVENNGLRSFFSQLKSPIILFECKNWSSKIGAVEIRNFAQKVQNRPRNLCSVGVLVTMSELTRDAVNELLGQRGKDFLVAIMEKTDLERAVTQRIPISEMLRRIIGRCGLR